MTKTYFCIFCGNSVDIKATTCTKCGKNLEEVSEFISLLEDSTLTYREVVEKKGKFKITEIRNIDNLSSIKSKDYEKELSYKKFFIFISITIILIWLVAPKFTNSNPSFKTESEETLSVKKKSILENKVKYFVTPTSRNLMRINGLDIISRDGKDLTVKAFSDNWYEILENRLQAQNQSITVENLSISFQPGGALSNALNQYFTNIKVIEAIIQYMINRASN